VAAGLLSHCYNLWLAPRIIFALNGYRPSFDYQNIRYTGLLAEPSLFTKAAEILAANTVAAFGGRGVFFAVGASLLGLFVLVALWRTNRSDAPACGERPGWRGVGTAVAYAGIVWAAHMVMFAVMIMRYPPVYESGDHWFWYYPLPYLVLLLFGVGVLLDATVRAAGRTARRLLCLGLIALACCNLASTGRYKEAMVSTGWWFSRSYRQTHLLRSSIDRGAPHPDLAEAYRKAFQQVLQETRAQVQK
jgi:hypothetical protein